MSDARCFLDTNVLVYLFDRQAPAKQARAQELLATLGPANRLVVSTQVLQEFYVAVTHKLSSPLAPDRAERAVMDFMALPVVITDLPLIRSAIGLSRNASLSFWDSLILAAASAAGCPTLLSEDLQDGSTIAGVRIENPFLAGSGPGA